MRKSLGEAAYTIVEVLIFLLVSSMLFTAVALTIGGQQAKAQFNEAVRDFESKIQDLINDTSTGFYASNNNFTCTSTPTSTGVTINSSSGPRGTNEGCILAGQVLSFQTGTANYSVYPLAGKQRTRVAGVDREVSTIGEANPDPITQSEFTEIVPYSLIIGRVKAVNGALETTVGGFAITTSFVGYSPANELETGDTHVNLVPLVNANSGAVAGLDGVTWTALDLLKNPSGGIIICLQEGTGANGRHANVRVGGSGSQGTTDLKFGTGVCV